jgi:hypothetical protein
MSPFCYINIEEAYYYQTCTLIYCRVSESCNQKTEDLEDKYSVCFQLLLSRT